MKLLAGKTVCITGSSRGIGQACAVVSAKHDATGLVLHYFGDSQTETELLQPVEAGIQAAHKDSGVVSIPDSIVDPKTTQQVGVEAFGRIDVLVSNAGICPFVGFLTPAHETWCARDKRIWMDHSMWFEGSLTRWRGKRPHPKADLSSISALVGGGFQWRLSRVLDAELCLRRYNICCDAALPGTIATYTNKDDLASLEKREYMIKRTALGRIGSPDDIAGPMVFLASDFVKYVTGVQLLVDSGLFVNLQ